MNKASTHLSLFSDFPEESAVFGNLSHEKMYADVFKKLYYYLYANSNISRAERLLADLSNLVLCKVACEQKNRQEVIQKFITGTGKANEVLLPVLLEHYPHLVNEGERFTLEDDVLRFCLKELSCITFQTAPAHILGEAFQSLMGPRLRGDRGQFFTPKSLVQAIIAVLNPPANARIVDPACGTGGFLVEAYTHRADLSDLVPPYSKLIGMDKDRDLCRFSEAILEAIAPGHSKVLNLNSLDIQSLQQIPATASPLEADYVVTNPPFGTKIKIVDTHILKQFALGHRWIEGNEQWTQQGTVKEAQDPQLLFLELCIRLLKSGGRMGIVLPEGVFGNSGSGYIWDYVRSQGTITALIDCPRTTFQPSTDIKTNILFFQKYEHLPGPATCVRTQPEKVWSAVALRCGHDRRGRHTTTTGQPFPDDFTLIGSEYQHRHEGNEIWQSVELTNPYYLVPRFYDSVPLQELTSEAERMGTTLISLKQLVEKKYIHIRKGHEVGAEAYGTGEVPFVRTSDIANYEVSIDPTRSVSEEVYRLYAHQQKLKPNDILMVCDGRYRIGRTAILHEHTYQCVVQSHLKIISVLPHAPVTAIELLYLLNLPMVQHQIRNMVFIQSTLGVLGSRLGEIRLPLPTASEEWQKTISEFAALVEGRAKLLKQLQEFEHPGYEL